MTPYYRYHALGNDYLVMRAGDVGNMLTKDNVIRICHRHFGVGSDGILLYQGKNAAGQFPLTIFNPDGSEAEKSGNGLRIFTRFLWDSKEITGEPCSVLTPGGLVEAVVHEGGKEVTVEMGSVSFASDRIPVAGPVREVLREKITVDGESFEFSAATVGNPHCVLLRDSVSEEETRRFGPHLEIEPRFPNRTNVQFMQVLDRSNIKIEIWERGAGYTLASGSSSSAAAAVAYRLGLCDGSITVHMPGGTISITVRKDLSILMKGGVTRIAEGVLYPEMLEWHY